MIQKYQEVCENLGWSVHEYEDGTVELGKFSPAGEDFNFAVDTNDFVENVKSCAASFDQEEHIEMWIQAKREGVSGVPSIRELVQDADDIDKMLQALATALWNAEMGIPDKSESDPTESRKDYNRLLWDALKAHAGHHVYAALYGDPDDPENVSLECEDCGEIILDAEIYTICARSN